MASIRRGTIVKDIIDSLKLQVGNVLPDQTSDKLVLTYDFSNVRVCNVVRSANRTSTGSGVVYTTPSNKDFYLVAVVLTNQSDATCDNTTVDLAINLADGSAQNILRIGKLATTAISFQKSLSLPIPIKLARNTTITTYSAFTAGASTTGATIIGYEVEQ